MLQTNEIAAFLARQPYIVQPLKTLAVLGIEGSAQVFCATPFGTICTASGSAQYRAAISTSFTAIRPM